MDTVTTQNLYGKVGYEYRLAALVAGYGFNETVLGDDLAISCGDVLGCEETELDGGNFAIQTLLGFTIQDKATALRCITTTRFTAGLTYRTIRHLILTPSGSFRITRRLWNRMRIPSADGIILRDASPEANIKSVRPCLPKTSACTPSGHP